MPKSLTSLAGGYSQTPIEEGKIKTFAHKVLMYMSSMLKKIEQLEFA